MTEFAQKFVTADGELFDTKADAQEHTRKPKVLEALKPLTNDDEKLSEWLATNRAEVADCFDVGSIRRVTKAEKKKLAVALERVKEILTDTADKKLDFLVDHAESIKVQWPAQKRMDDAEKATAVKNSLTSIAGSEELADWIVSKKEELLVAFDAGKVKRVIPQAAKDGLAEYRARMKAEKEAKAATEGGAAAEG